MTTTTSTATQSSPERPGRRLGERARRLWAPVSVLAGALLWWPTGFAGLEPWLHLPLDVFRGDVLFLGATAAAASVSLVVRSPWPRFAIVLVFSGLGWLLDGPTADRYPHERAVLAILLGAGALVGIILGARGSKGPLAAATVLAVVAGLSPTTWPRGLALALALALPFAVATWQRVAPTILSLLRLVLTWLVFALIAGGLSHGWETVQPGTGGVPLNEQARTVLSTGWRFVRHQWWTWSELQLRTEAPWLWLTIAVAVVLVAARVVIDRRRRTSTTGPTGRRT